MRNCEVPFGRIFAKHVILLSIALKEGNVRTLLEGFNDGETKVVLFAINVLPLSQVTMSVTLTSISLARVTLHVKLTVEPA